MEEEYQSNGYKVYFDGEDIGNAETYIYSGLESDIKKYFSARLSEGFGTISISTTFKNKLKSIGGKLDTYEKLYNVYRRTKKNRTKEKLFKRLCTLNMEIMGIIYS